MHATARPDGVYITDATLIARRYATSFLALDVLSALPLAPPVHAVDGEAPAERLLLLLRLLRLLRLVGVSRVRRATALPPAAALRGRV